MPHEWQVADRMPLTLVRRVCGCGCKGQRFQLVTADGRGFGFSVPTLGAIDGASLKKIGGAVSLGRELAELWQRIRAVAR